MADDFYEEDDIVYEDDTDTDDDIEPIEEDTDTDTDGEIDIVEINSFNCWEYGVDFSATNPVLTLVSEGNDTYHYELTLTYTVSVDRTSQLLRLSTGYLDSSASQYIQEVGQIVYGPHGMCSYLTSGLNGVAKPIRRGWVKAIVGNEIVDNKLMPIYANKRIIKGWIGDENNHPRFIFKTVFKDFEEIEDTSGYYEEYVDRDHAMIIKYQDTNYLISVSPYQIVPWDSTNNQFDITQNEDDGGFFPQGTSNYFVGCLSRVVCTEFDGSLHFFSVEHPGNSEEDSWIWRHWKKTKTNNVWTYDQISYPTGEDGAYPSTETYMDDCDKILYSLGNVVDHRYGIEPWIAVSYNNKIYIFCKAYADTLLTLVKWDEATRYTNKVIYEGTGGWNGFDVLPGVMYRGKMHFIITGLLNGVATTRHLVFDFKTEQVVQLQDVQMDIFGATAVSINDEIHVIGSDNSKRLHKSWDGNTWSTQPTLPVDMARDLAGVIDSHLHIFSEVSDNQNYSVKHYISDGSFN